MIRMGAERSRSAARGSLSRPSRWLAAGALAAAAAGCGDPPPGRTFYQRTIEPILQQKCAGNTSGCHFDQRGDAYQFRGRQLRRHVVRQRAEAARCADAVRRVRVSAAADQGGADRLAVAVLRHQGRGHRLEDQPVPAARGPALRRSDPRRQLRRVHHAAQLLDNGATENGLKPPTPPQIGNGSCSDSIPSGFAKAKYVTPATQASFDRFRTTVQPILTQHGCVAGNCHGAPQSDFYITCGTSDDELAFNFSQAWSFVNEPVEDSQILRIPLAVGQGGPRPHRRRSVREHVRRRLRRDPRLGDAGQVARLRRGRPREKVLRELRPADPAGARLLVLGLPQPGRDQRLQAAQRHPGVLLGGRAREELRAAQDRVHGDRVPRRAPRPRGGQGADQ